MSNQIVLHGALRERYGEGYNIACRDPVEAYRAMACQLPDFRAAIRTGEFHLVREMPNGALALTEDMLFLNMDNCRLHFLPCIEGDASSNGRKGTVKTILGVAVIGASLFIPGGQILGLSIQTMGIMTGAALALGGLALMLTPTPKLANESTDKKDSLLFSGNVNPSGQNIAIGVGFGKFRVPGIPVASRIVTNEISSGQTGLTDFDRQVYGVGGAIRHVFGEEAN